MTRSSAVLAALFALVPPATPTTPTGALHVQEKTVFYDVPGITTREIARQIKRRGPGEHYGSIVAGNTEVAIEWLLDMRQMRKTCVLAGVELQVEVKTTLPSWTDASRAPRIVRHRWSAFAERLKAHEARHRNIGLDTADRVQAAAIAVAPLPDCVQLRAAITSAVEQQIRDGSARNRDFDADTHHGLDAGTGLDR